MIKAISGNLFESHAEAWINTVNTVGIMGKGIAFQFKERFPENFAAYREACKARDVRIGTMFVTKTNSITAPTWIINFPTKEHWKSRSDYSHIERGLTDLIRVIRELKIKSLAIPPLGAGHGGLNWDQVKALITEKLGAIPIEIELFEPTFQPASELKKSSIGLTKARALVLALINRYRVLGFETTHLEIQKLAYFLQRMGQKDLRLQYKKFLYGPYAYNLQHLLSHLEGSYLLGNTRIMDAKPLDNIHLIPEKLPEIENYLASNVTGEEMERLDKVTRLMEGFESPFGVELLATVDWVIEKDKSVSEDLERLEKSVTQWNKRKAALMQKDQIGLAVSRLKEYANELYT